MQHTSTRTLPAFDRPDGEEEEEQAPAPGPPPAYFDFFAPGDPDPAPGPSPADMSRAALAEKKLREMEGELEKERARTKPETKVVKEKPLSKDAAEFIFSKLANPKTSKDERVKLSLIRKIMKYYETFQMQGQSVAQLSKKKLPELQAELQHLEGIRASSMSHTFVRWGWSMLTKFGAQAVDQLTHMEEWDLYEVDSSLIDEVVKECLDNDEELNADLAQFAIKYSHFLEVAVHWRLLIKAAMTVQMADSIAKQKKSTATYHSEQNVTLPQ